MPGQNLLFFGTTGTGGTVDGGAQSDPALYLGRFRSSTGLAALTSTLTAAQTAQSRHYIVDSARIGDGAGAHNMKWVLIQTGPAALSAARVEDFNSTTGTFKLDRPLSANAASGNSYSLFVKNNVWPDVTAAQALAGDTRYRCIAFRNLHGATLNNVRMHMVVLSCGADAFSQVASARNTGGGSFLQRASDTSDLFDVYGARDLQGGPDQFDLASQWDRPSTRAGAAQDEIVTITNTGNSAIWLRRVIAPGRRLRRSVAVMVVATTTTAGSDPNPLVGACILPYDILGTPEGTLEIDRFPRVGGGARYTGTVRDSATGTPISGRAVQFNVPGGSEGTILTDADPVAGFDTTDEDGKVAATYYIPDDAVPDVDNHVELVIGAGDELPNPEETPLADTLIIIQQGVPVVVDDVVTYLGTGTTGSPTGCRRLVFPSGIVDGAGDPVALAPLVYAISTTGRCLNPTRTLNVDNDALPHPITTVVKTLGSTRVVRFEEQVEDVVATEVWEAKGGASMTTAFFRLLYEYLLNARFIPGGGPTYIQWEPRDRTDKVFLVELLSLSAGGGTGEDQFDLADIMGGDVLAPAPDFDNVFARVSPVPTGLVDVDVRLRMRIISEA